MSPAGLLGVLLSCCVVCYAGATLLLYTLGFAFTRPCTAKGAVLQEYTGCFSWSEWFQSVGIVLLSFGFFAFASSTVTASVHVAATGGSGGGGRKKGSCSGGGGCCFGYVSILVLLALMLFATGGSMWYLAKPWETYQADETGNTLPADQWTIDSWLVFLGGAIFAAAAPFTLALIMVLCNLRSAVAIQEANRRHRVTTTVSGEFDEMAGERWGGEEGGHDDGGGGGGGCLEEELLHGKEGGLFTRMVAKHRRGEGKVPYGRLFVALLVLTVFFVATTVGSPIWNYSANSYFFSRSDFPWGNLSLGGIRSCSVGPHATCSCGKDVCPWFSFKLYTDTFMYYVFLAAVVITGAIAHNVRCCSCARRTIGGPRSVVACKKLPPQLQCYKQGCSVLEGVLLLASFVFFVFWFCYWYAIYGTFRFKQQDAAHDCWPNANRTLQDNLQGASCDQIDGSVMTNMSQVHMIARTMGHVSSLSFALTAFPVAKGSILLSAAGVSWEAALHWHRGLGAVAFLSVTVHMLLWWIKWAVEGSFTANLLFIDTNKWLWVTPVWQHYENWSVLMAQISWFFFAAMIVIAWRCRRKMYRLFYVTHHVGIVFLLFGLVHAWSFWYFVAPGLCLWWVDRMNRLVGSARALQVLRSKAQSHSDGSQVTVLEIYAPHIAQNFVPGQYALLNLSSVATHEWHPFTINVSAAAPEHNIVVCIKAHGRWTKTLHNNVKEAQSARRASRTSSVVGSVLVGGIYGGVSPHRFTNPEEDVVLVAGGIGVTPVISVFCAALAAQETEEDVPSPRSRSRGRQEQARRGSLIFVWTLRSLDLLDLPVVSDALRAAKQLSPDSGVSVHIHLTGAAGRAAEAAAVHGTHEDDAFQDEESAQTSPSKTVRLPPDEGVVRYHTCRPNFEELFSSMPEAEGGFAFACGPTALQEAVTEQASRFGFQDVHTETFEF